MICALLFFATTINYVDRQVIGLLKPTLEQDFHWTETDYSNIVMAFSAAYALGLLLFGRIVDKIGTKMGYIVSVVFWSIAAMLHAVVRTTMGFSIVRAFLGISEAGNFPTAIKATAEWFPKKERAFATGIFNSGANIGAVVAPVLVPWILGVYGWRHAFIWTGALGFIWLVFWIIFYEIPTKQKRLSTAEFEYIHSDADEAAEKKGTSVPWLTLLRVRQTWAFVFGKLLTDPIWWFFLFWLPSYFSEAYHIDLKKPNLHLVIVYTATTIGSIGGGYLSSYLIRKGWPVFRARKTSMLFFALCVVPIMTAQFAGNVWIAVALISLAAAAHQAWSANIFTTVSDMFPKNAVSSVVGIGGMAGSIGGMLFPLLVGNLLDHYKTAGDITVGYNILFVICGFGYLLAWGMMHLLAPKMERVKL
ncbi:MFS transporter [Chryseolinea lacunae]|uniref:MFS transporter n=1 Tax=Chryseolinea lacunae TaxID=2801331 RepID=A0ABS1KUB3_9BACT|nr:MFS transporter [Chryseolinea lacunae]MBL0742832.1 MFS transporter [Chryseolinea lacunae]